MALTGVCCSRLEEPKALMKMGLSVVIVGHVNFLLGALMHGVVLRHIHLHAQARVRPYAVFNVVAFTSGMVGIVVGILVVVLSKNKKSRSLVWSLFLLSLLSAFMAAGSVIGLFVAVVRAVVHGGRNLLGHCRFPDAISYSSVTNECPFDPTRIYSTTLILWVPLIVTCFIQLVFSARCFGTCGSFLGLSCCPAKRRAGHYRTAISTVSPVKEISHSRCAESPRSHNKPAKLHTGPPRSPNDPPGRSTVPARREHPPLPPPHVPRQHQSLPPTQTQPLHQINRERSGTRTGSRQSAPEQHQRLERGSLQRSSFWI